MRNTKLIGLVFIAVLLVMTNHTEANVAYGNDPVVNKPLLQVLKQASEYDVKLGSNVTVYLNITNWSATKAAYNLTIQEPLLSDWILSNFTGWEPYTWLEVGPGGSVSYSYSLIPKKAGTYEIGATQITYFDENNTKYDAMTQAMTINVYEVAPPISHDKVWRNIGYMSLAILIVPILAYVLNQIVWRKE